MIGGSSNKSSRSNSPLPTNKLESMSIETPKKSDLVTESASVIPTPVKQVLMRKSDLNVNEEFKKARGDSKEAINLIVIGHVDSGKSTLMGHLLFQLGQVSQKIMHKYEQESRKVGKQSFMYAWVLDETDEEKIYHESSRMILQKIFGVNHTRQIIFVVICFALLLLILN